MSEPNASSQNPQEKTVSELKDLAAGWEQTLDAIEQELEQNDESKSEKNDSENEG